MNRARLILPAFALLTLLGRAAAQSELEYRPPFWPEWYQPEKTVVPESPSRLDHVEFRGVLSVAGETFVTLVDTTKSRALMIPLNQSVEGISVSDLQVDAGTVRAWTGGRDRLLSLREARIVAVTVPPPSSRPDTHLRRDPSHVDRASDVAREIIRRREMRRQLLEAGKSPNMSPALDPSASNP